MGWLPPSATPHQLPTSSLMEERDKDCKPKYIAVLSS